MVSPIGCLGVGILGGDQGAEMGALESCGGARGGVWWLAARGGSFRPRLRRRGRPRGGDRRRAPSHAWELIPGE